MCPGDYMEGKKSFLHVLQQQQAQSCKDPEHMQINMYKGMKWGLHWLSQWWVISALHTVLKTYSVTGHKSN